MIARYAQSSQECKITQRGREREVPVLLCLPPGIWITEGKQLKSF
jgi:hypothetical protein